MTPSNHPRRAALALAGLLLALAACAAPGASPPPTPEVISVPQTVALSSRLVGAAQGRPLEGDLAPDFTYTPAGGQEQRLSDLQGKLVIVNFWATWCLPCLEELPAFSEAIAGRDDVVFLGVNRNETPEAIARFVNERGISLTMVTNFEGDIGDAYGVTSIPMTFFINRDGTIGARHLGALDAAAIAERIEALK